MTWQPASIAHVDAELVCSRRIKDLLITAGEADVFVANRIPNPRKPRMVIFNRDGGSADGLFDNPRMRCRVWDTTDQRANDLAALVAALMQRLVDGAPVLSVVKESGPYDVPDQSEQRQKYMLFALRTRGEALL